MYPKSSFSKNLSRSLPALCYHSIIATSPFQQNIHTVSPDNLRSQLVQLIKKDYTFLPIESYLKESKRFFRKKVATITFDDGYKDVLTEACPILVDLGIPFTIFLSSRVLTGNIFWRDKVRIVIDCQLESKFKVFLERENNNLSQLIDWTIFYRSSKSNQVNSAVMEAALDKFLLREKVSLVNDTIYLNKSDIAQLPKDLVTLGNHTQNHYRLSTLNKERQAEEISECESILKGLACPINQIFAIPFGENNSYNQDTIDLIKDFGFKGFVMTNQDQFGLKWPKVSHKTYDLLYSNRLLPKNEPFPI